MINVELRALRHDGGLIEEGRCLGCREELPTPINCKGFPVPSLLFPDALDRDGNAQGLCPPCVAELIALLIVGQTTR